MRYPLTTDALSWVCGGWPLYAEDLSAYKGLRAEVHVQKNERFERKTLFQGLNLSFFTNSTLVLLAENLAWRL